MSKKILITGCAGFIGSNLVDFFLRKKYSIIGIDNLSTGKIKFLNNALKSKKFEFVKKDLLKYSKIKKFFLNVELVIHLSANADVRRGPEHPKKDLKQNLIVTSNILEAMRENDVKKIIFASTGSVYGEAKEFPTPENTFFPVQTSFYGSSKLAAEALLSAYSHAFGIKCWIFRFVSVLGPRYTHGHIIDFYKKIITKKKTIEVLGNGNQKKSYIHVSDCIDAIYKSLKYFKDNINIINIGHDEFITVKQSLNKIKSLMKSKKKEIYQDNTRGWVGDNPYIYLDIKKLRKTGWKPKIKILEAVEDTVNFIKNNKWVLK
jgi:UDP-glucose 4-epimerase